MLYKDYLAGSRAQHPHDSATDDMLRAFEYMEGLCGNEAVFTSLVAFRESYYDIHRQVRLGSGLGLGLRHGHGHGSHQNKGKEHKRRFSDGSIENEIVKSLALNILDNAMSIVSPQKEEGGEEEQETEEEGEGEDGEDEGERDEGPVSGGGGGSGAGAGAGGGDGGRAILDRDHSPPQLVRKLSVFLCILQSMAC